MENDTPQTPVTTPIHPEHGAGKPVLQFYRDLVQVLTEPRAFITYRYPQTTLTYALVFGVVANWIGAVLEWLTRVVRHESLMDGFTKMRDQLSGLPIWKNLPADIWSQSQPVAASLFPSWLAEMFSVALSPFQSLLHFILRGLIFLLGAYLLVPKVATLPAGGPTDAFVPFTRDKVDLNHFMKLVAFSAAPNILVAILGFLPMGLNHLIGWIWMICFLVIGLHVRYRVSNARALGVLFLPSILIGMVFTCFLGGILMLLFGGVAALMGSFHV
jgi:hypothetical protein